jgi:fermentation-respiration switch protein FrsA (DUF1100 family)
MNEVRIAQTPVPLLLMHGDRDALIPADNSEALLAASPAQHKLLRIFPGVDHNNFSPRMLLMEIADFFSSLGLGTWPELRITKDPVPSDDDMAVLTCTPSFFDSSSLCPLSGSVPRDD